VPSTSRSTRTRRDGDRGFTLIELLVVVVIIGVLIAIAIPLYLNYRKGAENKSAASDARNAIGTLEQCFSDNGGFYPGSTQVSANGVLAAAGCATTGAALKLSNTNTVVAYYTTGTPVTAYVIWTGHPGNSSYACYSSGTGGGVKTETTWVNTYTYATGCP
jgi:type IV pilus assembly protein PilA